ncbi:MAG: hypothetical protein HZB38_10605 [Planctomycetes bacterium]|nr:hypothetical protein [Planctomycetota bacterium]
MFTLKRVHAAASTVFALSQFLAFGGDIRYRVSTLPWLPGHYPPNELRGINDARQIAGQSWSYEYSTRVEYGFRFDFESQSYHIITQPSGLPTLPVSVASNGTVAAIGGNPNCPYDCWLWWADDNMVRFGGIPGGSCGGNVSAVNAHDEAVGITSSSNGQEAFLWTPETGMIGLGDLPGGCFLSMAFDINDNSWIVGTGCSDLFDGAGFRWTPDTGMLAIDQLIDGALRFPGADLVNNRNQIAGTYIAGSGRYRGYLLDPDGQITVLPWLTDDPTEWQTLLGMSNRTHIVGRSTIAGQDEYLYSYFVWDPRRGMRDIAALLDPCRPAYQLFGRAIDVNSDGWILAVVGVQDWRTQHGNVVLIPYIPGDLDEDDDCDLQDLAYLLANFARTGDAAYANGDLDCDADVDLQDLGILLGNFGETLP